MERKSVSLESIGDRVVIYWVVGFVHALRVGGGDADGAVPAISSSVMASCDISASAAMINITDSSRSILVYFGMVSLDE